MISFIRLYRIFLVSASMAILVVALKYVLHILGFEPVEQSSLHNSVISSVTFVIGFLLSATIADYKESERMPSEFAAQVENMYDDAASIYQNYPTFDIEGFRSQMYKIATGFTKDARRRSYDVRNDIRGLLPYFAEMEKGGVPANFIVKLKQQQMALLRSRHRVNYIQRIKFIPSATILARSIVIVLIALLLVTDINPFYGGLVMIGLISFILIYMLILIRVISTPFHKAGRTQDDVSLFLIKDAVNYLKNQAEEGNVRRFMCGEISSRRKYNFCNETNCSR